MKDRMWRTQLQKHQTIDRREQGFFSVGVPTPELPEVKLTDESFEDASMLSMRGQNACVLVPLSKLLGPVTIKESRGVNRVDITEFHRRMLKVVCFTSCP